MFNYDLIDQRGMEAIRELLRRSSQGGSRLEVKLSRAERGWSRWGALLALACGGIACGASDETDDFVRPAPTGIAQPADTVDGHPSWTETDWEIFAEKIRQAREERLEEIPLGEAVAQLGVSFLGTTYTPQTLEASGPEHLVINFRELDCVTFVENILAMNYFLRTTTPDVLEDRDRAIARYEEILTTLRYRDGVIQGYPSRLHYFVDWIGDNRSKGLLDDISLLLGGVEDREPIDFMSTHPDAYRQLADIQNLERVRADERRLTLQGRHYLPEHEIASIADRIQNGDVIAATSTLEGLDVAHTGIALWVDGELHLLHAPLVGEDVQISEVSLADRILRIRSQDGIIVGRPLEWVGR